MSYAPSYRYDAESGLHQVRNRTYHSTLGRWAHRDPLGYHDSANMYEYVQSKPIVNFDPMGLQSDDNVSRCGKCATTMYKAIAACQAGANASGSGIGVGALKYGECLAAVFAADGVNPADCVDSCYDLAEDKLKEGYRALSGFLGIQLEKLKKPLKRRPGVSGPPPEPLDPGLQSTVGVTGMCTYTYYCSGPGTERERSSCSSGYYKNKWSESWHENHDWSCGKAPATITRSGGVSCWLMWGMKKAK